MAAAKKAKNTTSSTPKQTLLSILPPKVVQPELEPAPTQTLLAVLPEKAELPIIEETPVLPVPTPEPTPVTPPIATAKPKPVRRGEVTAEPAAIAKRCCEAQIATTVQAPPPNPDHTPIFQAVGIIRGNVRFDDECKGFVSIGNKEYSLFYASRHKFAYEAIKKEVQAKGSDHLRLIVYPRIMHLPKRDQPHILSFQLVGFQAGDVPAGIAKELGDFEFRLCGLWQFIPVCQTPCISVFKNFNKERLEYIKQSEADQKVRFMKASHVPLLWKDAPVRPFRFNPKLEKEEQGHSSFVEVVAKFLPERDVFGFGKLLSSPMEKAPNFLKASKEDKAIALKNKLNNKVAQNNSQNNNSANSSAVKQVWAKPKKAKAI